MSNQPSDPRAVVLGDCGGCNKAVYSGYGVTVDPEGGVWHAECRESKRPARKAAKNA